MNPSFSPKTSTPENQAHPVPARRSRMGAFLWVGLLTNLALAVGVLFYRLLMGEVVFWGLPTLQFVPWRDWVNQELSAGRLPTWIPFVGGGAPLIANFQSALYYPLHLLYLVATSPEQIAQWMGVLGIGHILIAGIGMWLLARRWKLSPLAQGIAILAYPLSSTLIARFGTPPMVEVAAWLPLILLTAERLLEGTPSVKGKLWRWSALVVVVAMQLLAGHAQWTFYSFVLVGSYLCWRTFIERKSVIGILLFVAGIGFATLLSAAQLLPTAELQRISQRADRVNEAYAFNYSLSPLSIVTFARPDFFGNPGDGSYTINGAYFETTAYIGLLPLVLASFGIGRVIRRRGDARMTFFALVAGVSVLFALGNNTPLYPLLYRYVPTFNLFQAPARWLYLTVFSLTILAALVASDWRLTIKSRKRSRVFLNYGIGFFVLSIVLQSMIAKFPSALQPLVQGFFILTGTAVVMLWLFHVQPNVNLPNYATLYRRWVIIVLIFIAADLVWANRLSNPTTNADFYRPHETNTTIRTFWTDAQEKAVLDQTLPFDNYPQAVERASEVRLSGLHNINILDRSYTLNNFDPLRPAWLEQFKALLEPAIPEDSLGSSQPTPYTPSEGLLQAGGIGEYADVASAPIKKNRLQVWLAARAENVLGIDNAVLREKMLQPDWSPLQVSYVEGAAWDKGSEGTVILIPSDDPTRVSVQVNTPRGGMIIFADTFYPDWRAWITAGSMSRNEGAITETPIYRANMAFRAVQVPAGEFTLQLRYQPESSRLGIVLSLVGVAILSIVMVFALLTELVKLGRQPQ